LKGAEELIAKETNRWEVKIEVIGYTIIAIVHQILGGYYGWAL